ncbi:hypothetical protein DUNSADRAFT_400 [Dunaliella salina]|uniref:DUF962 domain-containing protein n=1 Tax=Dunaliella salina TaxID=3046 RepID=A0ABQ7FZ10_DUNSA|nr:hypothetical protein DUNSADRAFT_400 [Dunaliella salina]|eukprot:KAF5827593.1 hypothetical protein DUNSADRAFT_400 [Dunaliella salina]
MSKLIDQLEFYAQYHRNPVNKAIHFFFIPTIFWSVLVWVSFIPIAFDVFGFQINAPILLAASYSLFYTTLDPLAGLSWAALVAYPLCKAALAFASVPNALAWAAGLHVFSWYMQIHPGHAIFEKRKPALMDSLVQAFATAPLFVWLELLFLLGYQRGMQQELDKRVEAAVSRRKAS